MVIQGVDLWVSAPIIESVNLTNPFTTLPSKPQNPIVDFNPSGGMFDISNDERKPKSESDDLDRQSSSEGDFEQFVLEKTPEKKPIKPEFDILREKWFSVNTNIVYKEDNQLIIGLGIPKINIAQSIVDAALKGNSGENAFTFWMLKC